MFSIIVTVDDVVIDGSHLVFDVKLIIHGSGNQCRRDSPKYSNPTLT
jgi:hypothetical protein